MGGILYALDVLNTLIRFGWPVILFGDLYLRSFSRHSARMRRGKWHRWQWRTFGYPMVLFWEWPFIGAALIAYMTTQSRWPINLFWLYVAIGCAVDYITGSDDPPWRRLSEKGKEILEKLRIEPPPKPAFDRA